MGGTGSHPSPSITMPLLQRMIPNLTRSCHSSRTLSAAHNLSGTKCSHTFVARAQHGDENAHIPSTPDAGTGTVWDVW
jgi:hypothetical protein